MTSNEPRPPEAVPLAAEKRVSVPTSPAALEPRGARFTIWLVWAALLGAHLALLATMLENVPMGDEWWSLASMLGVEPFDLEFLWRRHNEHRIPVAKLVMWVGYHLGNFDFRVLPTFYVLTLGGLAALGIGLARRIRGHQSWTDLVFPVLLLNWGHQENTLWGFQAQMIGSVAISLGLLFFMLRRKTPLGVSGCAAASLVVTAIALCGQNGIGLVPALAAWIAWSGVEQWRAHGPNARRDAAISWFFACVPVIVSALVFYDLPLPPRESLLPNVRVALEFLMNGLGRTTCERYATSATILISALFLVTMALIVVRWRQEPGERFRLMGLALFCLSVVSLALMMGYGRNSGFKQRYALLGVPFFLAIHFTWAIYGRAAWSRLVPLVLTVASIYCLPDNMDAGLVAARDRSENCRGPFVAAIHAGKPIPVIVGDASALTWNWKHMLDYLIPELRHRAIGEFRHIRELPEYEARPISLANAEVTNTTIENDIVTSGKDASITVRLPEATPIEVLRLVLEKTDDSLAVITFRMAWRNAPKQAFTDARSSWQRFDLNAHGTPVERQAIREHQFWCTVDTTVNEIKIALDGTPVRFKIKSLDALTRK